MRGSRVKVLLVPSFSYAAMHLFKARLLFTEALLSPDGIQSPSFSQTGLKPAPFLLEDSEWEVGYNIRPPIARSCSEFLI